jgi:hypothetical protein
MTVSQALEVAQLDGRFERTHPPQYDNLRWRWLVLLVVEDIQTHGFGHVGKTL